MDILVNRSIKRILVQLLLILVVGIAAFQFAAYVNALFFKDAIIMHDYELAGYLAEKHPELATEIQAAFTAEKSHSEVEAGKALLEQAGYRHSTELFLVPQANSLYWLSMAAYLVLTVLLSLAVLLAVFLFLKSHYKAIDRYSGDIDRMMEGHAFSRLEDSDEGSLPKLAASINLMTSSLYAHIEKEKQNRVFMKDMLENISHQLKTPLSALAMYNEIMSEEDVHNDVMEKFLKKSGNELERMQGLIAGLLKLARLDAGIIELNKESHSLKDVIGQAGESFETRLRIEQKDFEINAESSISYSFDRDWMVEALSCLIKNAVEHTKPGNHIRVLAEETPLTLKITVEDDGEGIHPEDINYVFKRFYRSKFSQNKQGTGIGLTLAKTIIEMHGGFISVESTFGKGTKFTIHLPSLQNCKL